MRLIDADEFRNGLLEQKRLRKNYTVMMLDETLTIDRHVHGHWIHRQLLETLSAVQCSVCHTTWDTITNFCPYCGSDMREDTE